MTTFDDLSHEVAAEAEAEGPEAVRELRGFERGYGVSLAKALAERRGSPAYWREMVWLDLTADQARTAAWSRSPAYWREMVWLDLTGYRLRGLLRVPSDLWSLARCVVRRARP